MKLLPITKLRITFLLALFSAEIVSLSLCYGHRGFILFLILSLYAIFLILPLLWIDWIRQRGIPYFDLFTTITFGLFATDIWEKAAPISEHILDLLFAGLFLLGAISISRKLLRPLEHKEGGRA